MSQIRTRQNGKKNDSANAELRIPTLDDIAKMSVTEIITAIAERNKDPVVAKFIEGLTAKLPLEMSEMVDAEKRGRSLVLSGVPESASDLPLSSKQQELESNVSQLLDHLGVECRPVELYRMGKPNDSHPRLIKLVLPSRSHWVTALSNAYKLRSSRFKDVYIRKSLTAAERKREFNL